MRALGSPNECEQPPGPRIRVWGLRFGIQSLGLVDQGLGFWGLGFRLEGFQR